MHRAALMAVTSVIMITVAVSECVLYARHGCKYFPCAESFKPSKVGMLVISIVQVKNQGTQR